MKFLADMGISPRTVSFLKELGYEAVHAHSLGIHAWSDQELLEKVQKEKYIHSIWNNQLFYDRLTLGAKYECIQISCNGKGKWHNYKGSKG